MTLCAVVVLEAAATGGLVIWAGWDRVAHALSVENAIWFLLCAGGQLVAYIGYTQALRATAAADRGVALSFPAALAVVSVGFGAMFSANTAGGFSVDYLTLQQAGMSDRRARQRVLGLSALEYAVLAPAVAVCGVLLVLGIGGSASASVALPWLAVVPGALLAAWLTSPRRGQRFAYSSSKGWFRRALAHVVGGLGVLRSLIVHWPRHGWSFGGALLYWLGDIVTFWAALRVFNVALSPAVTRPRLRHRLGAHAPLAPVRRPGCGRDPARLGPHLVPRRLRRRRGGRRRLPALQLLARARPRGRRAPVQPSPRARARRGDASDRRRLSTRRL